MLALCLPPARREPLWGAGETAILSQSAAHSVQIGYAVPKPHEKPSVSFDYLKLFFCSWGLSRLHAALRSSAADSGCFATNRRAVMQVGSEVLEEQQTNETEVDI